jgi:hypothetical protein
MNQKITQFLAHLNSKEFAKANDKLKEIVNEKHINRIKQEIINAKNNK